MYGTGIIRLGISSGLQGSTSLSEYTYNLWTAHIRFLPDPKQSKNKIEFLMI